LSRGETILAAKIRNMIMEDLGIVVVMIATAIIAGMSAAASIEVPLKNALVGVAGLFELYFLFIMLNKLG